MKIDTHRTLHNELNAFRKKLKSSMEDMSGVDNTVKTEFMLALDYIENAYAAINDALYYRDNGNSYEPYELTGP